MPPKIKVTVSEQVLRHIKERKKALITKKIKKLKKKIRILKTELEGL